MPVAHIALLVSWICLPVVGGPAIGAALASTDAAAAPRWTVALWIVWALGAGALAAPRTSTLTAARLVVPGGAVLGCWAAAIGDPGAADVAAATAGLAACALVVSPAVGARFVDGSSYGDERRVPLRTPAALLLGPAPLVVAGAIAGALTGPAMLLAGDVVAGAAATLVGWPIAALLARSLHRLHRRWLVFVPAGVVIHDHLALAEPVLALRQQIESLHPASADTLARDLTAGAAGLVLQLDLREPLTIAAPSRSGPPAESEHVSAVLVAPSQPGHTLQIAAQRRIATR